MLRRFVAVLAACLALIATQCAWGVPMLCRAEAEHRVCACHHEAGSTAVDECCTPSHADAVGTPGIALPVPAFVAFRLPDWGDPPAAWVVRALPGAPSPAFFAAIPARGPPAAPRFLAHRSFLI